MYRGPCQSVVFTLFLENLTVTLPGSVFVYVFFYWKYIATILWHVHRTERNSYSFFTFDEFFLIFNSHIRPNLMPVYIYFKAPCCLSLFVQTEMPYQKSLDLKWLGLCNPKDLWKMIYRSAITGNYLEYLIIIWHFVQSNLRENQTVLINSVLESNCCWGNIKF